MLQRRDVTEQTLDYRYLSIEGYCQPSPPRQGQILIRHEDHYSTDSLDERCSLRSRPDEVAQIASQRPQPPSLDT